MRFRRTDGNGEMEVDHRASPGLPASQAQRLGFDPRDLKEGTVLRAATAFCPHCGSHVVLNPARVRERSLCMKCNSYVCDWCAAAMREPDYVHYTLMGLVDMVQSGKYDVVGSSMSKLKLIPKGGDNG